MLLVCFLPLQPYQTLRAYELSIWAQCLNFWMYGGAIAITLCMLFDHSVSFYTV